MAADSPALTPAVRTALRGTGSLGDLLRPLRRRRVPVRVTALADRVTGDPGTPVLDVQARLDVGGTPVAWCEETVVEAVFAWDGLPARHRVARSAA